MGNNMSSSENNQNFRPNLIGNLNKNELLTKKINDSKQRPNLVTSNKLVSTDTEMMWGYCANKQKLLPLNSTSQLESRKEEKKFDNLLKSDSDKNFNDILDDSDNSIMGSNNTEQNNVEHNNTEQKKEKNDTEIS